jgi:hypothetical protein
VIKNGWRERPDPRAARPECSADPSTCCSTLASKPRHCLGQRHHRTDRRGPNLTIIDRPKAQAIASDVDGGPRGKDQTPLRRHLGKQLRQERRSMAIRVTDVVGWQRRSDPRRPVAAPASRQQTADQLVGQGSAPMPAGHPEAGTNGLECRLPPT